VRGPSYRDIDLSFIRRVPVTSGQSLEFRAEIFNLLNTVNLSAPASWVAGTANFGTITTALDPRVVQLAIKYNF
jgi:hypothetical protein